MYYTMSDNVNGSKNHHSRSRLCYQCSPMKVSEASAKIGTSGLW